MNSSDSAEEFRKLVEIIARLRNPKGGCPWDLEQTHQTLKPYLIEESYEVLDAIDDLAKDPTRKKLTEELGDVLLQVVLHSQIASDDKIFSINEVIQTLSAKLIKRHPHVFGELKFEGSKQVLQNWENIKQKDLDPQQSILGGVPNGMPSLQKSQRIGEKVARVGFDWPDLSGVKEKVLEELNEFLEVQQSKIPSKEHLSEEFGDLLFSLAQLARKLNIDAEDCLRQANAKFTNRFKKLEAMSGSNMKSLGLDKLQEIWQKIKAEEAQQA